MGSACIVAQYVHVSRILHVHNWAFHTFWQGSHDVRFCFTVSASNATSAAHVSPLFVDILIPKPLYSSLREGSMPPFPKP